MHVQPAYLELCEPGIVAGGELCVAAGASRVVLLPYFLSAGVHVVEDLTAARDELARRHPAVEFVLAEPLGRHPLLIEVVVERARVAVMSFHTTSQTPPGMTRGTTSGMNNRSSEVSEEEQS